MKKVTLFRSSLVLAFILILGIGGNVKAFRQFLIFFPIGMKNPTEMPDWTPPPRCDPPSDWSQTVLLMNPGNPTTEWTFDVAEPVMNVTLVFFYYQDYDIFGCPLDCSMGQCQTDETGNGKSPLGEFFVLDGNEGANRGTKKLEGHLTKGTYKVIFTTTSGSINVGLNVRAEPEPIPSLTPTPTQTS